MKYSQSLKLFCFLTVLSSAKIVGTSCLVESPEDCPFEVCVVHSPENALNNNNLASFALAFKEVLANKVLDPIISFIEHDNKIGKPAFFQCLSQQDMQELMQLKTSKGASLLTLVTAQELKEFLLNNSDVENQG